MVRHEWGCWWEAMMTPAGYVINRGVAIRPLRKWVAVATGSGEESGSVLNVWCHLPGWEYYVFHNHLGL